MAVLRMRPYSASDGNGSRVQSCTSRAQTENNYSWLAVVSRFARSASNYRIIFYGSSLASGIRINIFFMGLLQPTDSGGTFSNMSSSAQQLLNKHKRLDWKNPANCIFFTFSIWPMITNSASSTNSMQTHRYQHSIHLALYLLNLQYLAVDLVRQTTFSCSIERNF